MSFQHTIYKMRFIVFMQFCCEHVWQYEFRWPCILSNDCLFFNRDPSIIALLFALSFELSKAGSYNRIHSLFERALADDKLQKSVLLWRCYLAYEAEIACNASAARRVFFRAIHSCPWYVSYITYGHQSLMMPFYLLLSTQPFIYIICENREHA